VKNKVEAFRVLNGASGTLRVDNQDIAEVTGITADVEIVREDVQWGLGVDSKIVGVKGSGTITVDKVYSRFTEVFEELLKGKDKRFDIYTKSADPDAVDGQIETINIPSAWMSKLPLGWGEKTAKQTREYDFGFNPMESSFNDKIK
jgi:hypothetical protein